jgi:hypothetical protein
MLMNPTHTTPKIDAADAATIATRGQGFELELLSCSVMALAARCAQ